MASGSELQELNKQKNPNQTNKQKFLCSTCGDDMFLIFLNSQINVIFILGYKDDRWFA